MSCTYQCKVIWKISAIRLNIVFFLSCNCIRLNLSIPPWRSFWLYFPDIVVYTRLSVFQKEFKRFSTYILMKGVCLSSRKLIMILLSYARTLTLFNRNRWFWANVNNVRKLSRCLLAIAFSLIFNRIIALRLLLSLMSKIPRKITVKNKIKTK